MKPCVVEESAPVSPIDFSKKKYINCFKKGILSNSKNELLVDSPLELHWMKNILEPLKESMKLIVIELMSFLSWGELSAFTILCLVTQFSKSDN